MPATKESDTDKRGDDRKRAEQMYLDSNGKLKLVDIAKELCLPDNKIRKWKSLDEWDKKLSNQQAAQKNAGMERTTGDGKGSVPRKRGAPKGNKNAVGNRGNPHPVIPDATKHGAYSQVYWDVLDDEELELIDELPTDEEELLIEQIQLFSVRERRIMRAINKYRESDNAVAISSSTRQEYRRTFDNPDDEEVYDAMIQEKVQNGDRLPGREYMTTTQTENKDQIIARLESELSNVQGKKTRAIEALSRLHIERRKLEGDTGADELLRMWTEKVLKGRGIS